MAINYFDQLVQGYGGQEDELTQAIDALGAQAQAPVRDVRAERLAAQAPQVAQAAPGSIEALMAGQQDIQRIQAERAAALANLSAVGARRPSKRLLREGQSFMEAFRDPSEAQREFAIRAGMALLSDDGTKSLSQRIGQALGSGAQGLQEVRQQGIASEAAAAKAKFQQLGIEQQAAQQQFGLTKDILEAQRLAQPKAPAPSAIVKNYAELAEARKSGNDELAGIIQAKIDADTAPPPEERSAFDEQLGKKMAEDFTTRRTKAIETAQNIPVVENLQKQLEEGIISGTGANFRTSLNKALNTLGFDYNEDVIANTEAFAAAQAAQVAQIIKAFGAGTGLSDADREFALKASGGDIRMSEGAIRRILKINLEASRNIIKNYNKEAETLDPREMGLPYNTLTVEVPTGLDVKSATDEQLLEGF